MTDSLKKLRALVDMWRVIAFGLKNDVRRLTRVVRRLRSQNERLRAENERLQQQWWMQQDEDDAWVEQHLSQDEVRGTTKIVEQDQDVEKQS